MFDLPAECETQVLNYWTDGKYDSLCKATELPELQERDRPFSPGARGGRGRGRGRGSCGGRGRDFSGFNNRGGFNRRGGFNKRSGDFGGASSPNKRIKF